MPRFLLKVNEDRTLQAWDEPSEKYLSNRNAGDVLYVDARRARHPAHHRKAFAVLNFAFRNQEVYPSVDIMLQAVKISVGHVDEIIVREKVYYRTKSISFGQMGQDEFSDFYVKLLNALEDLTGIPAQTLEEGGRTPEV